MKKLDESQSQIENMLNINTMISDYIGKKKHRQEIKNKLSIHKPLLIYDLKFKQKANNHKIHQENYKKITDYKFPSTEKLKLKTIVPIKQDKDYIKLYTNTLQTTNQNNTQILGHRAQSAKLNHKVIPKSQNMPFGLKKKNLSTFDTRKKISSRSTLKNRYQLIHVIGRGSFSTVYKAKDILTNKQVAIKILTTKQSLEPTLFKHLNHEYIIKNLNLFELDDKIHMVFEYYPKTLSMYLKQVRDNISIVKTLFKQLCKAVEYIHLMGIIHRDIKLQNIIVKQRATDVYNYSNQQQFQIKLIDFGLAVKIQSVQSKINTFKDFCGTPNYVAPEILNGQIYEGKPTDCWALGIVLYIMLVGRFPFKSKEQSQLYRKIKKGRIYFPQNISDKGKRLILNLLKPDPNQRYNIHQILIDPWFQ